MLFPFFSAGATAEPTAVPMTVKRNTGRAGFLTDFLEDHDSVKYVRLHWVDFSGVLRTRFIPKWRSIEIANGRDQYSLAQNCMIIPLSTAPACFPAGPERWELCPDWDSVRVCSFAPSHATVLCSTALEGAQEKFIKCPRQLLKRVLERFESPPRLGFEIEFVLLDESSAIIAPLDRLAGQNLTAGLRGETLSVVEEILAGLEGSSLRVYHFHSEVAGQVEIALAPDGPLEAIDALVLAEETIRTVSVRHGLKASTSPKPVLRGPHNGCHVHFSFDSGVMSDHFLAGILHKIKPLCAIGMANFDSYVRSVDDEAGFWIGWGTENRDLPIRRIDDNHWEFRFLDSTANPYLFIAAVMSAGLDGVVKKKPLIWKDCDVFPDEVSAAKRKEYGVIEAMPKLFRETLDALKGDSEMEQWIGYDMLKQYVAIKEKEISTFYEMAEEDRRLRLLEYF